MDNCGICMKPALQLFETGTKGVFACFKCQPLVPEVTLGDTPSEDSGVPPEENLTCGLCNKTFEKNIQLQNHIRNHRAERRFVCTYCNKAFSQSNNLRAHLRIHTNERPYKCKECGKAFTQVTNLNNHVRLHTGERPFACPEPGCNKAYAQVTNLNQHKKRHMVGRPFDATYDCTICGEQFDQRNHMYTHRREAHGEVRPRNHKNNHERSLARDSEVVVVEQVDNESAGESDTKEGGLKCVFSSCEARFEAAHEHTEHLLRAHQLRILSAPVDAGTPRRGRPPKVSTDNDKVVFEVPIENIKDPLYLPKLKVENMFQ